MNLVCWTNYIVDYR